MQLLRAAPLALLLTACGGDPCPASPPAAGWEPLVPHLSYAGANVCAQGEALTPTDGLFVQNVAGAPAEISVAYEALLLEHGWTVRNRSITDGGGAVLTVERPDQPGYFMVSIAAQLGQSGVTRITISHST